MRKIIVAPLLLFLASLASSQSSSNAPLVIDAAAPAHPMPHFWEKMFGSGRAVLSLRESYRRDLHSVRQVTGFSYVRFHAILHDEIGIYDENDIDRNPRVLKELARTTGGERYLPRSPGDLLRACNQIAREIRSGYTIGYVPPDRDGAYHRVRVVLDAQPRKLNVRTRPGYFASGRTAQQ